MTREVYKPHAYQLEAIKHVLSNTGAALLLEPGLGKTSVVLKALSLLLEGDHVNRVLVIAPLRVCYGVWPNEVAKWDAFAGLDVAILHGPKKNKALASDAPICVINPEGLQWLSSRPDAEDFDVLVIDESTKFKNRDTLRFSILRRMLPQFTWRWILTGTPAPNNLLDLWAQMYVVDGGQRLGKFITHFRQEYFDEVFNGFAREYRPRPDTAQRIQTAIGDVALYMSAVEHLDMPSRVDNMIHVDLPPAAMAAYRRVEDGLMAVIDSVEVSTAQASAVSIKLRQITGGTVYGQAGEVAEAHDAKIDALLDLIEEQNGQPLLVAVAFTHEAEAIAKCVADAFGTRPPYLGGGISPAAGTRIAEEWNAGKLPVLLAHPASVAHGLNLQAGGHAVCWFTPTWSLEEYIQFNGRVWRQGQKRTVVIHHLVARKTIDETVIGRLRGKDRTQTNLLQMLKLRKKEIDSEREDEGKAATVARGPARRRASAARGG